MALDEKQQSVFVSAIVAGFLLFAILILIVVFLVVSTRPGCIECAPELVLLATKDDNSTYQITVLSISSKKDIENYIFYLKDEMGQTHEEGEIALQNISEQWHGIDITWDNRTKERNLSHGGEYSDPIQAQVRINDVIAGNQDEKEYQKGEGPISISFVDGDLNGKLSAGDIFKIRANNTMHPAKENWLFELKYDISGDIIGGILLGD